MGIRVGVLADDLTGAMDAGLQLAKEGYRVMVVLEESSCYNGASSNDMIKEVVIADTNSRNIPPEQALERVQAWKATLEANGYDIVYKKVDSTLRGNIGVELSAVSGKCIIFAPALPFNGRTTVNGIHYVNGIRLQDTELAGDPFSPISTSDIKELICSQLNPQRHANMSIGNLILNDIREGIALQRINQLYNSGVSVIICDTQEEKDFVSIMEAVGMLNFDFLFSGSAGLFSYMHLALPKIIKNAHKYFAPNIRPCVESGLGNGPSSCIMENRSHDSPSIDTKPNILILSGSPAEMSKRQISYASHEANQLKIFTAEPGELMASQGELQYFFDELLKALKSGMNVLIDASGKSKLDIFKNGRERMAADSENVQKFLCQCARYTLENFNLRALVIFGGDTARSISLRLGAKAIQVLGETEPYIPYGKMLGTDFGDVTIVTKAGGFGDEKSLVRILHSKEWQKN